jgi:hypothetical protein
MRPAGAIARVGFVDCPAATAKTDPATSDPGANGLGLGQKAMIAPSAVLDMPMATRDHRLADFNNGPPPLGQALQLLAEDHNGTYVLPFRCEWRDGAWYAVEKTNPLEANVVGWRTWRY